MTDSTRSPPRAPTFGFIRGPQDFFGGLALLGLAILAWWATRELPGQSGFAFGPGTAPRLFILLLAGVSILIMVLGVFTDGPLIERYRIRGPLFITAAVLVFAASIRPLGLIISAFVLAMISAAGSDETKWREMTIWAAVLAAFCAFLFPYVLNLPMQLCPQVVNLPLPFCPRY